MEPSPFIEITRSYTFKKNIGNYQSVDVFCSQKIQCSPENKEVASRQLSHFCRNEVAKDLAELQESHPEFFNVDNTLLKPIT